MALHLLKAQLRAQGRLGRAEVSTGQQMLRWVQLGLCSSVTTDDRKDVPTPRKQAKNSLRLGFLNYQ